PVSPTVDYFASFYTLIRRALCRMPHIQELNLMVLDPNYQQVLDHPSFHSLSHFECRLGLSESLISFLNRHRTIVYLQLSPGSTFETSSVVLPRVVLPKLQYFVGNSECGSAVVPDASLRAAFLSWENTISAPLDIINSLERSSGETINLISCRRSGWNLDLIDLISIRLPDIYVLIITNLFIFTARPNDSYVRAIERSLSRFSVLRDIRLHCFFYLEGSRNLDEEFDIVSSWGKACPSLIHCALPHSQGMKWVRFQTYNIWIPDATDPQGAEWTWKMLRSSPTWKSLSTAVFKYLQCSETSSNEDKDYKSCKAFEIIHSLLSTEIQ
ncbi:hypothetical protein H0H93_005490, partial [Arthromyces matolae]